jgi:signal transduction histidine kinase/PAS domain-containing protein
MTAGELRARPDARRDAVAEAPRLILEQCKKILGAEAGFVALRRADGAFGVALLDAGPFEIDAANGLPAPFDRLGAKATATKRPVFSNTLSQRPPRAASARGSRTVRNALLAPILVAGEVAGLLGLFGRPEDFTRGDVRLAAAVAEMAAATLHATGARHRRARNRRALEHEVRRGASELLQAEETFQTLVENLPDLVARFDRDLRYLYVSPMMRQLSGHLTDPFVGRTNREMGFGSELVEPWDEALRRAVATGLAQRFELPFPDTAGTRHFDWRVVPEWGPDDEVSSVLTVARDVTDRWLAHAAEARARTVAEALREATVALTRSLDRETVLATLLEWLGRMVPFDRASVMLLEGPSRVSVRAVFDGHSVVPLAPAARTVFDPAEHPVVHDILKNGAPVLVPDVRARPDWSLPTDRLYELCWMGVPLFARGDVAGLFSLSKREPGYFNEEHVKLAEAMSSQASVAVENSILYEQMRASTERMQALSRRLADVQESERRDIARDLHDEAGQALVSLRLGLRLMERQMEEGQNVSGRVSELVQRTDAVIDGLHRLAADLRPASLDHLGLEAALRQYAESAVSATGPVVRFKARGFAGGRPDAAVETALYRIAQEAMVNVLRHADATRVDVLVQMSGSQVRLIVEDDGVGFEPDLLRSDEHIGLVGMRERAEALGGSLLIESSPGKGTTLVVEVPSANPHPDR